MIIEIGIGAGVAATIFLLLQGYNVLPIVILAALFFALYQTTGLRGMGRNHVSVHSTRNTAAVSFDDIGGQAMAKNELLEALEFIKNSESVQKLGIRALKGILLTGPPGTGKTLLAKAAAHFTDSIFLSTSGSEFVEVYAGVGAQRVRQLFEKAREQAKKADKQSSIVFIDEIDVLGGKRGQNSSHMEYDQTLNQLLVEMDGINSKDEVRVLIVAATNRPDILDPALLRPGRFDRIVNLRLPDKDGRLQILRIHVANKPLAAEVCLEDIAKDTFGFSGADLESLANEAAIQAMREGKSQIEQGHFAEALDKVMMGEKLQQRPNQAELARVAAHEVGHALISELVRPESVSTVTVTPRGDALGYMRQTPEDDQFLYTQDYLEGQIDVLLAGSVSEEVILTSRSTGNASDFAKAVDLAKTVIVSGMSPLGIVCPEFIPKALIHQTINRILQLREDRVRAIIIARQGFIRTVVEQLLVQESVSGGDFRAMLQQDMETAEAKIA
jgi:cell division protease FtsH